MLVNVSYLFSQASQSNPLPLQIPQGKKEYAQWLKSFERSKSGLYYKFESKGNGKIPKAGDMVVVHYRGLFRDNNEFDNSYKIGHPLEFNVGVGQVILGWDEALSLMPEGSKITLVVPPRLGYGSRDNGPIPANSTLVFEIELLRVVPQIPVEPYKVDKKAYKTDVSGIKYAFILESNGMKPDSGYIITMHFTGYLPNGKIFNSSILSGEPEKFVVGTAKVIKGVNLSVMLMKQGSKARFIIPSRLAFGDKGYYTLIPPNTELTYDIELIEVKPPPTVDPFNSGNDTVSLASGLHYIPFHTAGGETPQKGDIVAIHYSGYFQNGKIFDSSVLRDQPIMFAIGEGHVMPGMDEMVRNMRVGDKVRALIPWKLGYGEEGNPPIIPPKTDLIFDIELLSIANR
jgi:FKBP-type peptidyl-prolyl cis-trans isomerase